MGFERLAPQPASNLEVTSGEELLCKQKGCSKPATGYVTVKLEGPSNDEQHAFQLRVPIRIPKCDEHRAVVGSEMRAHPSTP
jgi:hypothetical protein